MESNLQPIIIEPPQQAKACVIWMHGLGAGASDMSELAKAMPLNVPVKHVSLPAPSRPVTINAGMVMPAWYDITGISLTDREDEAGILASSARIVETFEEQKQAGFLPSQIYLAGFSQGGAMALFTALKSLNELGGVMALSAYLPLRHALSEVALHAKTPVFMASGNMDEVVRPEWSSQTVEWLKAQGFDKLQVQKYPMGHQVCFEEVQDLAKWLESQIEEGKS